MDGRFAKVNVGDIDCETIYLITQTIYTVFRTRKLWTVKPPFLPARVIIIIIVIIMIYYTRRPISIQ